MIEIWEKTFLTHQTMWGLEPAPSAIIAKDFFVANSVRSVFIPGIGYGRNAQVFKANGIDVTGIEISKTAIDLARKHYGSAMTIYHGSVTEMPFDDKMYDGVFCYAVIHLLDSDERQKLIRDCYNQLSENGFMVFVAISKSATSYQTGNYISKDRYEVFEGVRMFFYDVDSIRAEFSNYGLFEISEVQESHPFFLIKCKKTSV